VQSVRIEQAPHAQQHAVTHREPAPHREPTPAPRTIAPRPVAQVQQRPHVSPPPARMPDELDSDLLKELETALDADDAPAQPAASKGKPSLDEEMAKLLGELSSHKR